MARLIFILILSSVGANFLIHYLKNFLLKEKLKFRPDFDGWLERISIICILFYAQSYWPFIPIIIAIKILYRILLLGFIPGIINRSEPGAEFQKVLLKSELAFDLFLSPTLAILVWILFK